MALIVADNIHKDYPIGEITMSALNGLSFEIGIGCLTAHYRRTERDLIY